MGFGWWGGLPEDEPEDESINGIYIPTWGDVPKGEVSGADLNVLVTYIEAIEIYLQDEIASLADDLGDNLIAIDVYIKYIKKELETKIVDSLEDAKQHADDVESSLQSEIDLQWNNTIDLVQYVEEDLYDYIDDEIYDVINLVGSVESDLTKIIDEQLDYTKKAILASQVLMQVLMEKRVREAEAYTTQFIELTEEESWMGNILLKALNIGNNNG